MSRDIEAIFLDVGNTLRLVVQDQAFQAQAKRNLVEMTGAQQSPDDFWEFLEKRYQVLRKRAKTEYMEASEQEMWTQWMLPEFPKEKIAPLAGKLTRQWRDSDGRREARPDVIPTVIELYQRGYVLGIIANTITESEIPDWLEEANLTGYFKSIILSSKVGFRKPGPEIYLEAARRIGVAPARCMYLGDNPARDIEGARLAGYGMVIIIREPDTMKKVSDYAAIEPDMFIDELRQLLDIFPPRKSRIISGEQK